MTARTITFDNITSFTKHTIRTAKLFAVKNRIIQEAFILVKSVAAVAGEAVAVGGVECSA